MSQHDFDILNQLFPATRTDLNAAFVALASNSSGDAEPAIKYANQWWYDTDTNTLKIRNEVNSNWISICTLDQSNNNVLSITTQGLTLGATALTSTGVDLNQLADLTRGSLIYGNASGATARLAKGAAATVLTSDGTDISWAAGAGGGGTEFIASLDASNSATLSFTGFDDSKYDNYIFYFANVTPGTTNATFQLYTSTDGGDNYDDSAGDYVYQWAQIRSTSLAASMSSSNVTYGELCRNVGAETGQEGGVSGTLQIFGPHLNQYTRMLCNTGYMMHNYGWPLISTHMLTRKSAEDVNAIRMKFFNSNMVSGTITMYGIKNAQGTNMPRFHNIDGEMVQFTTEEETARDADEQAWAAGANDRDAVYVREERDALLMTSDWTQVNDSPVDESAWVTYRQLLRDVPSQSGFPNTITWPNKPS